MLDLFESGDVICFVVDAEIVSFLGFLFNLI